MNEVSDLTIAGLSISAVTIFSALLKSPMVANFIKSRKVFRAITIILILATCKFFLL